MKQAILYALAFMACTMTAACVPGGGEFQAGTWEIEGWMEADSYPGPIESQIHSAKVTERLASMDARTVFFNEFYHGGVAQNVVFSSGEVSGYLDQQAIAPFPEHTQEVTGWYRSDAFEVRIKLPEIAGIQSYQVVKGKLVEPLE